MSGYRKRARVSQVFAPTSISGSVNTKNAYARINLSGREFVGDVVSGVVPANGTSPFGVFNRLVRPTDYSVYRWLAPVAHQFGEFYFRSMRLVYEPLTSTLTTGNVAIYFDPDPSNAPVSSWGDLVSTGQSVHGAVWARHVLQVPTSLLRSRNTYYCRDEYSTPTVIDPLEHYPGQWGVASEGVSATTADVTVRIGKVYVEYEVCLMKPEPAYESQYTISGLRVSPSIAVGSGSGAVFRFLGVATSATDIFRNEFTFGGAQGLLTPNAVINFAGNTGAADTKREMYFTQRFEGILIVSGAASTTVDTPTPTLEIGRSIAQSNAAAGTVTSNFQAPGGAGISKCTIFMVKALTGARIVIPITVNGTVTGPYGIKVWFLPFPWSAET